jgi:hypothetical protein
MDYCFFIVLRQDLRIGTRIFLKRIPFRIEIVLGKL